MLRNFCPNCCISNLGRVQAIFARDGVFCCCKYRYPPVPGSIDLTFMFT